MQPALHREQPQNRQGCKTQFLIRQSRPGKHSQDGVDDQRDGQAIQFNSWCTGKDSNLRTSLGGTDLQSVGFNHSPTCAETLSPSAPTKLASGRLLPEFRGPRKTHDSYATIQGNQDDASELAHENHYTSEKDPRWSALENLLPSRPRRKLPSFPETVSWSWRRDSNPRPSDYKSDALPTELRRLPFTKRDRKLPVHILDVMQLVLPLVDFTLPGLAWSIATFGDPPG